MNNFMPRQGIMKLSDGLKLWSERQTLHSLVHPLFPWRDITVPVLPAAVIAQQKQIPDVSYYQKLIDWDKFRTQTDAVIIRAGQNIWIDEYWLDNWTESKRLKMLRGCYWFYDGRIDPGKQAALLVSLIEKDLPEMEVWIDWEHNYGGGFEGLKNVVSMLQRIEQILPSVKVGIYTGYYFFIGNSNPITNAAQYAYLKTKPLWLAWYTNDATIVKIPQPWSRLDWWQWGTPAIGSRYGVQTLEIDMNYYNGTMDEFYKQYGGEVPTQPPGNGVNMITGKIKVLTNIRNSPPGGTYQDIGDLLAGDIVTTDEIRQINGYPWWHLTGWTRNNSPQVLPGVECWAYGVNIEEVLSPPAKKPVSVTIAAAPGTVITTNYDDGTSTTETA